MLMLLFIPIFYVVACAHRYMQLFAPSNLLIARVRTSPPYWRTAMLLLALAYALIWATHFLTMAIGNGAPGWLNLVGLILAWDAIKFALASIPLGFRALFSSGARWKKRFCLRKHQTPGPDCAPSDPRARLRNGTF